VEHGAYFGSGKTISVGRNSGIGINSRIERGTTIGDNVMMGRDVLILSRNHKFVRTDIPMIQQGFDSYRPVWIGDDVWIGARAIILPGVRIESGSLIGAGSVVAKSVPEYSIVVGSPAHIVRSRLSEKSLTDKNSDDQP
jgi:maltose O-acetyltransferase